jgi:hypothetical protein
VDGEHERGVAGEAGQEQAVEDREHDPLEVDDVRPLAADQGLQRRHAAGVLQALGGLGDRPEAGGQPLGEAVEQRQHPKPALVTSSWGAAGGRRG